MYRLRRGKQFDADASNFKSTVRSAVREREYAGAFSVEDEDTLVVLTVPAGHGIEDAIDSMRPKLKRRASERAKSTTRKKRREVDLDDLDEDVDGLEDLEDNDD